MGASLAATEDRLCGAPPRAASLASDAGARSFTWNAAALAERRLERVQNWLVENAAVDALSFKPEYVTDESRQVVVRLTPLG